MSQKIEAIDQLIRQHEGILRDPFLDVAAGVYRQQIQEIVERQLGISWGYDKIDFRETPPYAASALAGLIPEVTSHFLERLMDPIKEEEQDMYDKNRAKLLILGEQISEEDRLGVQKTAKRVLRAAKKVIKERGWTREPDDLAIFLNNILGKHWIWNRGHFNLYDSGHPFRHIFYRELQLDRPEGTQQYPAVNFAARFAGQGFKSVRFLQFASKTGLMYTEEYQGVICYSGATIDINLNGIPEVTNALGINTVNLPKHQQEYPEYFQATTALTTDILVKMGFLKAGETLDPRCHIPFRGTASRLRHLSNPKLRAEVWRDMGDGSLGSDPACFSKIVILYSYDTPFSILHKYTQE